MSTPPVIRPLPDPRSQPPIPTGGELEGDIYYAGQNQYRSLRMGQPTTELILVRHGETAWNTEGRIQGHLDIPLNATGHAQAAALGRRLSTERPLDAIYSSDLDRAYRTAMAVAGLSGLIVRREPKLRERHLGVLQGLTREEAIARQPAAWEGFRSRRAEALVEGGEALGVFVARISDLLLQLCKCHPGERLLLVTHGGVLDAAYRVVSGVPLDQPRDFPIDNAALNVVTYRNQSWGIECWGDVDHLVRGAPVPSGHSYRHSAEFS